MKPLLFLIVGWLAASTIGANAAENELPKVRRLYRPLLIHAVARAMSVGSNPLKEAKTDAQRRFVAAYMKVLDEGSPRLRTESEYRYMEPLRRCGIAFPEGTTVKWTPLSSPLMVIHTPTAIKQIEELLGLDTQE